jgi:hypothetical protein
MKTIAGTARILLSTLLLAAMGCERGDSRRDPAGVPSNGLSVYQPYVAARLDVTPLTDFVAGGSGEEASQIKVYVGVLDSFDCQIKSPGTFRFELYEHVEGSSEPRGSRVALWPDVDLTDSGENNSFWRDFLRVYEFNLDFKPGSSRRYILDVTFMCPMGERLSDDFVLEYAQ